ncbi:helicase-related protein [Streptosporangium sp. NPDC006007]|uniref:helicase-related protein n=1 Tax=Streptosporangium sp. NPDC006007 TaxID=3154575 RepID=UPI0033B6ED77
MTASVESEVTAYAPGSLVAARGREWVVLPESTPDFVIARPLNGDGELTAGFFPEEVVKASFPDPTGDPAELGDYADAALLRTALRIGFRGSAGPFRSLASIAVEPRAYQLVPLLLALRMDPVRLLIADDVGIGKTIESALIAKELLEQGSANGLTVLCSPALAEQWAAELRDKFALPAVTVLPSTVVRLENRRPKDRTFFEHYPVTVVSTDFIKSDARRALFLEQAPNLVIVDEAHTCVGSGVRARRLRHELLKLLAERESRHLILVTATPHSGHEDAFRQLVGVLKPHLAAVDFRDPRSRTELARHFVQRRRHDIRRFLDERTAFPGRREFLDEPYPLQADYLRLTRQVLGYARESVRTSDGGHAYRTRWWSALGLLRSVASSPAAAAATLRNRGGGAEVMTEREAEALGRATVLDETEDEPAEGADAAPAAADELLGAAQRERLTTFADAFDELRGPRKDKKLDVLIKQLKGLYADGYDTIVFCRYIPTANYLKEELVKAFRSKATVDAVTGELPPEERVARIASLTEAEGRRILVATDCLSEGVNLQDGFQAVVHYDLAWNPTRHEQREGRVDRFGQTRNIVKAVTLYGVDNGIDGIVLDVLLRKSRKIRDTTGVSVPVPERSGEVLDALFKGLLLRDGGDQLPLDLDFVDVGEPFNEAARALHAEWDKAAVAERRWRDSAERESRQVTKYAHSGLDLGEIETEVTAVRAALGSGEDVVSFTRLALSALGADVVNVGDDTFTADLTNLPGGVRQALGVSAAGDVKPVTFRPHPPVKPGERALVRTDPAVTGLARYVLDAALDRKLPKEERPARRTGVVYTTSVPLRTLLLLVRYRFHVSMPDRSRPNTTVKTLVAEDAQVIAYRGGERLPGAEAAALLAAGADGNVMPEVIEQNMDWAIRTIASLKPELDELGAEFADELQEAHRRVRKLAGAYVRGLGVTFQPHADVLGAYVYLPGGTR